MAGVSKLPRIRIFVRACCRARHCICSKLAVRFLERLHTMRIALGIEYDGSDFAGWQSQEGGVRTVQGSVEQALTKVADRPVRVVGAGLTYAGGQATANVIHFSTEPGLRPRAWVYGANANLPK